ncbi:MAG TPA: hypothetical protein PK987_09845 [Ferruginibacter sp.]|nr:hypothetical protein [Ferruginibacter sp.]
MTKYKTFLTVFIISVIAMIALIICYFNAIFNLISLMHDLPGEEPSPISILNTIFDPSVILSLITFGLSSLFYRIIGIVCVAKNKVVSDGEKALWIIGFVLMGFITAIVFLVMAKGKNFVE